MPAEFAVLFLLGLVAAAMVFIGVPYLLFARLAANKRIAALEVEVRLLRQSGPAQSESEGAGQPTSVMPAHTPWDKGLSTPATAAPEGDDPTAPGAQAAVAAPDAPPQANDAGAESSTGYVLTSANVGRLGDWLRTNWLLAVAAVSLILGGLFLVQYGIERGLMTPVMRVLAALALGAAFLTAGEVMRRRLPPDDDDTMRHLPSVLSGPGIVVLILGILSANALYGLIGAGTALGAVAVVALGAVVMGWVYAAALPAIGLLGAGIAPFLVRSASASADPLFAYFVIITVAGLAIDSYRRWAWVSALALSIGAIGILLVYFKTVEAVGFLAAALAIAAAALILPDRRLVPRIVGASPLALRRPNGRPAFPALLALGGMVLVALAGFWVGVEARSAAGVGLALAVLVVAVTALGVWLWHSPALDRLVALPALAYLLVVAYQHEMHGALFRSFATGALLDPPETSILWGLMGGAAIIAAVALWRSLRPATDADPEPLADTSQHGLIWPLLAAGMMPATALMVDQLWVAAAYVGAYPWALIVMAAAALNVLMVERRARGTEAYRQRDMGLLAAGAMILIALALFLMLTKGALTLALAVMMVAATLLDRRFDLPALGWIAQLGAAVIGFRLLVSPGMDESLHILGWGSFLLVHLGAAAGFAATRALARDGRATLQAVAESALVSTLALMAMLTLLRLLAPSVAANWVDGVFAGLWGASGLAQIWRLRVSQGAVVPLRLALASGSLVIALRFAEEQVGWLSTAVIDRHRVTVPGWPILDGHALALWPMIAVLAVAARLLQGQPRLPRWTGAVLAGLSSILAALWAFVEIRRLWRGPDLSVAMQSDGELYTYTLVMLLVSVLVLAVAVLRRSELLRRIAMAGVSLTILKVFLLDMAGLSGLTRAVSFVGLGMSLVALAWINIRIRAFWPPAAPQPDTTDRPADEG
ncbi:MAG: DUF2339 domain-containing protein [Paracoccaceae bacterium]